MDATPRPTSSSTTDSSSTADIFSSLLDLESQFYNEGYNLGVRDGATSGRIEGRVFGLEKGFEKFVELGRLKGRAVVWREQVEGAEEGRSAEAGVGKADSPSVDATQVSVRTSTTSNERLKKHIARLFALTDSTEFTTLNTEDDVNDVDERLRDAKGKERIIRRILGEREGGETHDDAGVDGAESRAEDAGDRTALRVAGRRLGPSASRPGASTPRAAPTGEMEDFVGLPGRKVGR